MGREPEETETAVRPQHNSDPCEEKGRGEGRRGKGTGEEKEKEGKEEGSEGEMC